MITDHNLIHFINYAMFTWSANCGSIRKPVDSLKMTASADGKQSDNNELIGRQKKNGSSHDRQTFVYIISDLSRTTFSESADRLNMDLRLTFKKHKRNFFY